MRSRYKIYDKDSPYFITSTIIEWVPIFMSKTYFDILVSSIRYCQEHYGFAVYAYVILDNHFHMVCRSIELSKVMQACKRHTTKKIIQQLETDKKMWTLNLLSYYKKKHKTGSEHQLWQEGFHPQQITSDKMLNQKIEYIHHNPVRRGLVSKPEDWVYSSASDCILNRKGFIELQAIPV